MCLRAGGPREGMVADGKPEHGMEMGDLPSAWTQSSRHPGKIIALVLGQQGPATREFVEFCCLKGGW